MDFSTEVTLTACKAVLKNGILHITINRPDKLNALNQEVFKNLNVLVDEIYTQKEIKAAIITGAGEKAFVAGADIAEFSSFNETEAMQLAKNGVATFNKIEQSQKPIVAAVNGFALGGGCELAMACHVRIASDNAKFGQPEVNLGLVPGYSGTQRLIQYIGKTKALELLMTADIINAQQALTLGLVNYVVSPVDLIKTCEDLLAKITTKSPNAIKGVIACVNAYYDYDTSGFDFEIKIFGECFAHPDFKEGSTAFMEKRKAIF